MKSYQITTLNPATYLACSLVILLASSSAYAKDDIIGQGPNGDPVANLTEFTLDVPGAKLENGTPATNRLKGDSSNSSTVWWVNDNSNAPWERFTPDSDVDQNIAAHFLDPVGAGEAFWVGISFERGMEEYTSLFREVNGIIPDGTNVYFGLSNIGTKPGVDSGDVSNATNLSFIDNVAPNALFDDTYDWFHYELDGAFGDGHEFTIKPDSEFISTWVAYYVLPDGESLAAGTDWDRTGFDKNGKAIEVTPGDKYYKTAAGNGGPVFQQDPTQDVIFNWTVDSKSDTYTDETNPNYGTVVIPEPSSTSLVLLVFTTFLFRRRRA